MEVIKSNKGSEKLCHNGYAYTKKHNTKSTIRWECCKRGSFKCAGAVVTDLDVTNIKSQKDHCHAADIFEVAAMKLKAEIKTSVMTQHCNPNAVIGDKMKNYPVEVRARCGDKNSLKRTVRRAKRANIPKEPTSLADVPYPLPEAYTRTGDEGSADFLIHDNGSQDSRVIVFGSESGLQALADSDTWFVDGTFHTAPTQFTQLFVIRVPLAEQYITSVYGFLPSKTQLVYEELFSSVLDACLSKNLRPNPTRIVVDFEVAIHNALRNVLGTGIEIQGCFYHLTQSTWRKIQNEGLQAAYLADESIGHFCGQIDGLAFLPVTNVSDGISYLREHVPECLAVIVDYFDSVYVSGCFRSLRGENGLLRFRRLPPRFPPHTWNVHEATMTDRDRTNNVCEGWNNGFRTLVGQTNPSIWFVIDCIKKDNIDAETLYHQHQQGIAPKRRKTTKAVNQQKD